MQVRDSLRTRAASFLRRTAPRRWRAAPWLALALGCSASSERGSVADAAPKAAPAADAGTVTGCAASVDAAVACVDEARLRADVTFMAAPRVPQSAHWQAVQDLCAARFAQHGFEVERHAYATGVNVIGKLLGTDRPGERVILSAHYDHIADCPGADDNATGVAAVLETARVLQGARLSRTLILACWDEEERGLIGARAYAARARADGDTIVAMTSLEMIGYKNDAPNTQQIPSGFELLFPEQYQAVAAREFRGDFVSLVALDSAAPLAEAFDRRAHEGGLPTSRLMLTASMAANPLLADLGRSDHAAFWLEGFPALLVTDTSNFRYAQYHCRGGADVPELLDFAFLTAITRASTAAHLDVLGLM